MPLPQILYPPPGVSGFEQWTFWHDRDHLEIQNAIQTQKAVNLTIYELDPINLGDISQWLLRHQTAHSDMNGTLRLQGADLQTVDFNNEVERRAWMWLNYQEHLAARQTLGI